MKKDKLLWVGGLAAVVIGCASVQEESFLQEHPQVKNNSEKIFIGVPSLLALEGTTVRLNEEWMLTAGHNKLILMAQGYKEGENVFYHPTCDVALIREHGVGGSEIGLLYSGEYVYHTGYAMLQGFKVWKGEYLGDIVAYGWEDCYMSASSAENASGMSGGGVYTKDGTLVGITHGTASGLVQWENGRVASYPSVFTPLYSVKDWLFEMTGEEL